MGSMTAAVPGIALGSEAAALMLCSLLGVRDQMGCLRLMTIVSVHWPSRLRAHLASQSSQLPATVDDY